MGLDWNPMARPKPGAEAECETIMAVDLDSLSEAEQEKLVTRFQQISEGPFETLNAPRVGQSPEADAWLLRRLNDVGELEGLSRAEAQAHIKDVRKEMAGYYVLDLLPECAGFPVYTPDPNDEVEEDDDDDVDRYTFRAEFLNVVKDLLGPQLHKQARDPMTPNELREYGTALLNIGRAYAKKHGVEALEQQREPPDAKDESAPEARAHILFAAAQWCLFWSELGHGLDPYP